MSEWKKVKIGDFLTEREGRYKPDDKEISKHKRLEKIDFSGTIHISDKPTKTDMIIVHPGDLVISGINVAKGAVAVYQGNEPVCATIHYSSYTFDSSKVDLDYFKYFVKSPAFIAALQKQVKGGIKTEIKPRHLLPLEISIPDLQTQQEIVKKISSQLQKTERLSFEIESQKNYAKLLRQNILQEAIEGKLTEDWRKQNPVQKGNPDYDVEALFEKIQKGEVSPSLQPDKPSSATTSAGSNAARNARSKSLTPIIDEEKPFEIPNGWKWVRLDNLFEHKTGKTLNGSKNKGSIIRKYITTSNLYWNYFDFDKVKEMEFTEDEIKKYSIQKGDLLVCEGGDVGRTAIWNFDYSVCYQNHIHRLRSYYPINIKFYYHILYLYKFSGYIDSQAKGIGIQGLSANRLGAFVFPLPSLKEQKEIVNKVETLLAKVTILESQIQDRKSLSDKLIFGIIKENLEGIG